MIIRHCTVAEILLAPNIDQISAAYAAECAIAGLPHPLAKLEAYQHLEAGGALYAIGAFVDDVPVGFIGVLAPVLPHYSRVVAVAESYFVLAEYRRTGAGLKLLRAAEDRALAVGSPGLLISAPYGGVLEAVMPRLGYVTTNTVFFKAFADV